MPDPERSSASAATTRAHAKELGNEVPKEPLIFLKPPSSVIADGEADRLPTASEQVEYEGEIGVVIGEAAARCVARTRPRRAIAASSRVNDVTARDLQKSDVQWTRAKGFDTFCPVGELAPAPADLAALDGRHARERRGAPATGSAARHGVRHPDAPGLHLAAS